MSVSHIMTLLDCYLHIEDRHILELLGGCPGVPVHEGIPIVFITIHGLMTQFVNVSFFCVPVHEDTTVIGNCNMLFNHELGKCFWF